MHSLIQVILFDLGNTLVYFGGDQEEVSTRADLALAEELHNLGVPLDKEAFAITFRSQLNAYYEQRELDLKELTTVHVLTTTLAEFGIHSVTPNILHRAMNALYNVSQSHWLPESDAAPTLKTLRDRGFRLGVISNAADDEDVQWQIDKAGLRPCLDIVMTSAACGIRKPDPRIFQRTLKHWGVKPENGVIVGDTLNADILGGNNIGMTTVWLTRRADTPANRLDHRKIVPDFQIDRLSSLPSALTAYIEKKST